MHASLEKRPVLAGLDALGKVPVETCHFCVCAPCAVQTWKRVRHTSCGACGWDLVLTSGRIQPQYLQRITTISATMFYRRLKVSGRGQSSPVTGQERASKDTS